MTELNNGRIGGPAKSLLTPENCCLMMIDYQPVPFSTVRSMDPQLLINNAIGVAKTAKAFGVPTILTSVLEERFDGPFLPQLREVFDGREAINRTGNNPWEDERVVAEIEKTGRRKILFAGLWTGNCIALPVLSAMEDGFDAYVVADACGDANETAHAMALQRMIQAGARPITWQILMLELLRDWASEDKAAAVNEIAKLHAGVQGQAAIYFEGMVAARAGR